MYLDFKENKVGPIQSVLCDGWTSHPSLILLSSPPLQSHQLQSYCWYPCHLLLLFIPYLKQKPLFV